MNIPIQTATRPVGYDEIADFVNFSGRFDMFVVCVIQFSERFAFSSISKSPYDLSSLTSLQVVQGMQLLTIMDLGL